jgi:DNA polymerase-3 subunit epsilon
MALTDVLTLYRPLAFIDLETTGIDPARDRIIDLALVVVHPNGRSNEWVIRVDPGVPIPLDASRVHGIVDQDVRGCPPFAAYAQTLAVLLAGCDLAGFNLLRFDLPLLEAEFQRCGLSFAREGRALVDAMVIFHQREQLKRRNLSAAVRHYCGRAHLCAHSALADVRATIAVLTAQLQRYPDLPRTVDQLHRLCQGRGTD